MNDNTTDEVDHDPVERPRHYRSHPSGIECIEITRGCYFSLGNAIKYIWRADLKNGAEDYRKARWYLRDVMQYGAASHPPFKAARLLMQVVEAETDPLRQHLFLLISSGQVRAAIAAIDDAVGAE